MATPSETVVPDTTEGEEDQNEDRDEQEKKHKRKRSSSQRSSSSAQPQGHGRKHNRHRKFYALGTPTKEKDVPVDERDGETQPFVGRDEYGNDFVYSADDEPAARQLSEVDDDDESIVAEVVDAEVVDNVVVENTEEDETDLRSNNARSGQTRVGKGESIIQPQDNSATPRQYISRREFKPDGLVTEEYVRDLLGGRHRRIATEVIKENMRRINELKTDLSRHFKTEVERKMVSIAVKCPLVKQTTFEGLQKLWASLDPKTTLDYTAYEDSYWRITQKRSSDLWPARWDILQEVLYMKRHNMRYKKEGKDVDKTKGCIAMMCGLAIRKARRRIWYYGEKEHGRKISAVRPPLPKGRRGKDDRLNRKDWTFREEYVRCVKGENSQLRGSIAQEDSEHSDSPSPRTTRNKTGRIVEQTKTAARVSDLCCHESVGLLF